MTTDHAASIDTALGNAIRAARFSRGLTQRDLAVHLGVTRATIASYETGRRKLPAETLIHIARLCGQPLGFFDPTTQPSLLKATRIRDGEPLFPSAEQLAVEALIAALELRPDALPVLMNVLEHWLRDQESHRT